MVTILISNQTTQFRSRLLYNTLRDAQLLREFLWQQSNTALLTTLLIQLKLVIISGNDGNKADERYWGMNTFICLITYLYAQTNDELICKKTWLWTFPRSTSLRISFHTRNPKGKLNERLLYINQHMVVWLCIYWQDSLVFGTTSQTSLWAAAGL